MMRTLLAGSLALALAACGPAAEAPATVLNAADTAAWAKYTPWKSALPEVVKTGTGVEYIVLGSGPADGGKPDARSRATAHVEGRFNADSKMFDSTFERGETLTFPVAAAPPGLAEVLQLMRPGDSWLVYTPSALAFGAIGMDGLVPPNTDLVFEIELESFVSPPEGPAPQISSEMWAKFTPWNSASPDVKKTASGVQYVVIESGPAEGALVRKDQDAELYYEGRLASGGEPFDSAFARGMSDFFPVAAVVPGYSEVLQLMRPGDRWLVFLPSALAYGERGARGVIPPNADLVFEILVVAAH